MAPHAATGVNNDGVVATSVDSFDGRKKRHPFQSHQFGLASACQCTHRQRQRRIPGKHSHTHIDKSIPTASVVQILRVEKSVGENCEVRCTAVGLLQSAIRHTRSARLTRRSVARTVPGGIPGKSNTTVGGMIIGRRCGNFHSGKLVACKRTPGMQRTQTQQQPTHPPQLWFGQSQEL